MTDDTPTFSHSGNRYLLGYTAREYGIWDRQAPGPPLRRFPKTDDGWKEAWAAYQSLESPERAPAAEGPDEPPREGSLARGGTGASGGTVRLPTAPGATRLTVTPHVLAQVLTVAGWGLLAILPLSGIANFTVGSGFATVMNGLSQIVLGPAFWGICLALARLVRRDA